MHELAYLVDSKGHVMSGYGDILIKIWIFKIFEFLVKTYCEEGH